MIDFIPEIAIISSKKELTPANYVRFCVAIRDEFYWCVCFGATAKYLDSYGKVGSKVFLKEWKLKLPNNIIVDKLEIVNNGRDYGNI